MSVDWTPQDTDRTDCLIFGTDCLILGRLAKEILERLNKTHWRNLHKLARNQKIWKDLLSLACEDFASVSSWVLCPAFKLASGLVLRSPAACLLEAKFKTVTRFGRLAQMHKACCTESTYGPAIVPARTCGRGSHIPETFMKNRKAPMLYMLHCRYNLNV